MNKTGVEGTKEGKRKEESKEEIQIWIAQWKCSLHYIDYHEILTCDLDHTQEGHLVSISI
jgi:hypothetical protein